MTDFVFSSVPVESAIPSARIVFKANHLVAGISDTLDELTATLAVSGGIIIDDTGAVTFGFPIDRTSTGVNTVTTPPLLATTDSTGAGRHLRTIDNKSVHYILTVTGTANGKKVTASQKFDVDAETPDLTSFTELVGQAGSNIFPILSTAARGVIVSTTDARVTELVGLTAVPGPAGPIGPTGGDATKQGYDLREWGSLTPGSDVTTQLQSAINDLTNLTGNLPDQEGLAPQQIGLAGGTLHIPGDCVISDTINIRRSSLQIKGDGTYSNPWNYLSGNARGRGTTLKWEGAADIPMWNVVDSRFVRFSDMRMEGNNDALPSAMIFYNNDDPPGGPYINSHGANTGMFLERVQLGAYPWSVDGGASTAAGEWYQESGRMKRGVWVGGTHNANNDRLYMTGCDIVGPTIAGIQIDKSQSVWSRIENTRVFRAQRQSRATDAPAVALITNASISLDNFQILVCDRGIEAPTLSPIVINAQNLNMEKTEQFAKLNGAALFVRGGYSQLNDKAPNTTPPTPPVSYRSLSDGLWIDATVNSHSVQIVFDGHTFTNPPGVSDANVAKIDVTPATGGAIMSRPAVVEFNNCVFVGFVVAGLTPLGIIDTTLADSSDQRVIGIDNADGTRTDLRFNQNRDNASDPGLAIGGAIEIVVAADVTKTSTTATSQTLHFTGAKSIPKGTYMMELELHYKAIDAEGFKLNTSFSGTTTDTAVTVEGITKGNTVDRTASKLGVTTDYGGLGTANPAKVRVSGRVKVTSTTTDCVSDWSQAVSGATGTTLLKGSFGRFVRVA